MRPKLETIISSIQQLTIADQLELMYIISQSLSRAYNNTLISMDSGQEKSLEQLVNDRQKSPIADLAELAVDFWPDKEKVDDFIEYTYRQRQEDRLNDR